MMQPPMDDDFLALLEGMDPEMVKEMLYPYQQEQGVLDQEMALAAQLRQGGAQGSSPIGAALGGLSNAVGNVGGAVLQREGLDAQRALGGRMQTDASGRLQAMTGMRKRQQEEARQLALEEFLRSRGQGMGFSGPMGEG